MPSAKMDEVYDRQDGTEEHSGKSGGKQSERAPQEKGVHHKGAGTGMGGIGREGGLGGGMLWKPS